MLIQCGKVECWVCLLSLGKVRDGDGEVDPFQPITRSRNKPRGVNQVFAAQTS